MEDNEPIELALCESEQLVLRANQPYIFKVIEGCKRCAELHAISNPVHMKIDAESNRTLLPTENVVDVEDDDELYTIEEFLQNVACGALIDDDGHGNFSDGKLKHNGWYSNVHPSTVRNQLTSNPWATHVVWYNK